MQAEGEIPVQRKPRLGLLARVLLSSVLLFGWTLVLIIFDCRSEQSNFRGQFWEILSLFGILAIVAGILLGLVSHALIRWQDKNALRSSGLDRICFWGLISVLWIVVILALTFIVILASVG